MNKYVSRGLYCALFVGGISVPVASSAHAMDASEHGHSLSGQHVLVPVDTPVEFPDSAVTVAGYSRSADTFQDRGGVAHSMSTVTAGDPSIRAGNQVVPGITARVEVRDDSVPVMEDSRSGDFSTAEASSTPSRQENPLAPIRTRGGSSLARDQGSEPSGSPVAGSGAPAALQVIARPVPARPVTDAGVARGNVSSPRASGETEAVGVGSKGVGSAAYGVGALLAILITVGGVLSARGQALRG
ncbi:MAG: hypothetical protein JWL94_1163 [Microbacteriaceae bacterium]|nr:hypothetical protein [Microbacteriaceae bacterium]